MQETAATARLREAEEDAMMPMLPEQEDWIAVRIPEIRERPVRQPARFVPPAMTDTRHGLQRVRRLLQEMARTDRSDRQPVRYPARQQDRRAVCVRIVRLVPQRILLQDAPQLPQGSSLRRTSRMMTSIMIS